MVIGILKIDADLVKRPSENLVVKRGVASRAGQCAPSPQERRHTFAPGRAAGGPRQGFVPQAQAL
jgi:hypothetical protein